MSTVVVEVGAHKGRETFRFLEDASAYVYAFEPVQEQFIELVKQARMYPRLVVLPFAVDIGDNQEPLFHHDDGNSTLDPPVFGAMAAPFTMTWTIRLDTFMKLYDIQKIDYLRIDAPHREEACLESLGDRVKDVERGRVRRYAASSTVPSWLYDHGFSMQLDTLTSNIVDSEIRYWRPNHAIANVDTHL